MRKFGKWLRDKSDRHKAQPILCVHALVQDAVRTSCATPAQRTLRYQVLGATRQASKDGGVRTWTLGSIVTSAMAILIGLDCTNWRSRLLPG